MDKPAPSVMRVLARTSRVLQGIEQQLIRLGVPYKMLGGQQFTDRREVKDFLAFWQWTINPKNELALERFSKAYGLRLTHKKRKAEAWAKVEQLLSKLEPEKFLRTKLELAVTDLGVMRTLVEEDLKNDTDRADSISIMLDFYDPRDELGVEEMLDSLSLDHSLPERQSGVVLQTIHSAKGQEADELVLAGWDEGLLPFWKAVDDREQLDEERRLAFVALTRSKGKVVITTAEDRGGPAPSRPSRFLSDIQHLVEDESCR